jgi:LysM repeat protein
MIAKKYGVSEEKIRVQNNLDDNNTLVKDSVIVIPGAIKKVEASDDDTKLLAKNTKNSSSKINKKTSKKNPFSKHAKSEYVSDD